jgi:hypothetical protein
LKPAHIPWRQRRFTFVGHEDRRTFEDVDEFVLLVMRMTEGGHGAGLQRGQIDAEYGQAELIA